MSVGDHRFEAFKIEEALLKDARTCVTSPGVSRTPAEYPPAVRFATPIVVPLGGVTFGIHFRKGGRVMP